MSNHNTIARGLALCAGALVACTANAQWTMDAELTETLMSVAAHDTSMLTHYAGYGSYDAIQMNIQMDLNNQMIWAQSGPGIQYQGADLSIFTTVYYDPNLATYISQTKCTWGINEFTVDGEVIFSPLRDENKKKKSKAKAKDKNGKEFDGEIGDEDIVYDKDTKKYISVGKFYYKEANGGTVEIPVKDDYEGGGQPSGNWIMGATGNTPGIKSAFNWDSSTGIGTGLIEVVPEPASMFALSLGLAPLALRWRKRK